MAARAGEMKILNQQTNTLGKKTLVLPLGSLPNLFYLEKTNGSRLLSVSLSPPSTGLFQYVSSD